MVKKARIIQYVAYSISVDENGVVSYDLHTSNHTKYSIWANMPKDKMGLGTDIRFRWFRLPTLTEKFEAIKLLMDHPEVIENPNLLAMLQEKYAKRKVVNQAPGRHGWRKKIEGVTVTTPESPTSTGIKKLKETTEKKSAA